MHTVYGLCLKVPRYSSPCPLCAFLWMQKTRLAVTVKLLKEGHIVFRSSSIAVHYCCCSWHTHNPVSSVLIEGTHMYIITQQQRLHCLCFSPGFASHLDHCQGRSLSCSASVVEFSPIVRPTPNSQPCDLIKEDFSTPSALYRVPVCPDHMPTVIAAYSTAISRCTKYFCCTRYIRNASIDRLLISWTLRCYREHHWFNVTKYIYSSSVLKYNFDILTLHNLPNGIQSI